MHTFHANKAQGNLMKLLIALGILLVVLGIVYLFWDKITALLPFAGS